MSLLDDLRDVVGVDHVLVDPDLRRSYETDWTGRFRGEAVAVVRPASTDEVAGVLRVCAAHGAPVQVQGGTPGWSAARCPRGARCCSAWCG
jgi:FAD/FMN-containing dehydrogenase